MWDARASGDEKRIEYSIECERLGKRSATDEPQRRPDTLAIVDADCFDSTQRIVRLALTNSETMLRAQEPAKYHDGCGQIAASFDLC